MLDKLIKMKNYQQKGKELHSENSIIKNKIFKTGNSNHK